MHFLRFGSSIPGSYWGCCAVDIIQEFKFMPSDKASIEFVSGDSGLPIMFPPNDPKKRTGAKFLGPTYEDIFLARLRVGTFNGRDMPNHVFYAVLTESQLSGPIGKAWLKILKEQGFEFVRTTDNSVYTGASISSGLGKGGSPHKNHIFALYRNVGNGTVDDPFTPPKAWTDLKSEFKEPWEFMTKEERVEAAQSAYDAHKKMFDNLPKDFWMTEDELNEKKVPIHLAGKRSRYPQQLKTHRETLEASDKNIEAKKSPAFKGSASKAVAA